MTRRLTLEYSSSRCISVEIDATWTGNPGAGFVPAMTIPCSTAKPASAPEVCSAISRRCVNTRHRLPLRMAPSSAEQNKIVLREPVGLTTMMLRVPALNLARVFE
jgi:hypothetical protein